MGDKDEGGLHYISEMGGGIHWVVGAMEKRLVGDERSTREERDEGDDQRGVNWRFFGTTTTTGSLGTWL